jgi:hypothetical protein
MRYTVLCVAAAITAIMASACSGILEPNDRPLSGEWRALCGVDVACALDLHQSGSSVTGRYGGSGILGTDYYADVSGKYDAPSVHLEWTVGQVLEQFDGVAQGDTAIVGVFHLAPSAVHTFRRTH